jgi:L,D-transpeptidase catalytic domain
MAEQPAAAAASTPRAGGLAGAGTAVQPAAGTASRLSKIDHAAWVSTRSSNEPATGAEQGSGRLSPIDHVLVIEARHPASDAEHPAAAVQPVPKAASRPEVRSTPSAATLTSGGNAPAALAQPVAARTPSISSAVSGGVPAPAATPGLAPGDHALWVSARPPSAANGTAAGTDHVPPDTDHRPSDNWIPTPGQEMLASLHLPSDGHLTEGEELLSQTRDDSFMEAMSWSVIVHKSAYLVDVYYKGKHFGSFPAVFGRNPDHSAKLWEGDLRTPEGMYIIVEKYHSPRWRWFLRLNYPNSRDHSRYETMLDEGLVPVLRGHYRRLGGAIGIHGTDRPRFNRLHLNWTLGCISLDNDAIDELERILPVGTMVIIKQ